MSTGNPHPIQLQYVGVKELSIKALIPPEYDINYQGSDVNLMHRHSDFDEEKKSITVLARAVIGDAKKEGSEENPYALIVELVGLFLVDTEKFPIEKLESWATVNGPILLHPYLREHIFSLTSRCGFRPQILELIELPYFKNEK